MLFMIYMYLILVEFLQNEAEEEFEGVDLIGLKACCDSEPGTETEKFSPIAAFSSYLGFMYRDLCWGMEPQENKIFY